jgi:antitoxin HicB
MSKKSLEYQVVIQEELKGGFSAWVPELPGCASQGETLEETITNIREAISLYLQDSPAENNKELPYKNQFTIPIQIYA